MMRDDEEDEQFYRDTESIAFPKLDDQQLSLLEPLAKRQVLKQGDLVFKVGQRELGLAVVLRGEIEVFERRDDTEQILATGRERDFVGLAFVAASIFLFGFFLNAYQVTNGHPFLKQPRAEDAPYAILGIIIVVVIPYLLGTRFARLFRRSRVRFFRSYQHQ